MKRAIQVVTQLLEDEGLVHKTPGVCGGEACVRGRIPVWAVIMALRGSPTDIYSAWPDVTEEDVNAAVAYAQANPQEIEAAIAANLES